MQTGKFWPLIEVNCKVHLSKGLKNRESKERNSTHACGKTLVEKNVIFIHFMLL